MEAVGLVASPYYFERVAILSRKGKDYRQEIHYCETYIRLVEDYYAKRGTEGIADVRKGPRFQAILARNSKGKRTGRQIRTKRHNNSLNRTGFSANAPKPAG